MKVSETAQLRLHPVRPEATDRRHEAHRIRRAVAGSDRRPQLGRGLLDSAEGQPPEVSLRGNTSLDSYTDVFGGFHEFDEDDEHEWWLATAYKRCPRVTRERLDPVTGLLLPDYCKSNCCPFCSQFKARLLARAMAYAAPTHLLTVTAVGSSWPEVVDRMKRLIKSVREAGPVTSFALVWTVERSKAGDRHVHALAHGGVPSTAVLTERSYRLGMGRVDLKRTNDCRRPADYLLKGVRANFIEHLDLNGGRMVHATRDYWRAPDGMPLRGQAEAMRASRPAPSGRVSN